MNSCWIFGGAPIRDKLLIKPPNDAYIIAADGGYSIVKAMGLTPDLVLGDFDSLYEKPVCREIITAPAEKDDTDTMLAVKIALERGFDDISIAGGIGGRLDHTFANIQTLAYIKSHEGFGRLIGESDTVELIGEGTYFYKRREEMYLSLFSYGSSAVITITGAKYCLDGYRLDNTFPLGVSNEIIDDECSIIVSKGQILVVFSKKSAPIPY